jgi:5-methylcytosine-specific restriction endonuclease McrA
VTTPKSHGRSGRPWRRIREQILTRDPQCMIRGPKCTGRSTTVDHIVPLSVAPHLAHDLTNLRGACVPCNSRGGQKITTAKRKANGTEGVPPWVLKTKRQRIPLARYVAPQDRYDQRGLR